MHPFSEAVSTAAGKKEVKEKPQPMALKSEPTEGTNPDGGANAWDRIDLGISAESDPDIPNLNLWRKNRI